MRRLLLLNLISLLALVPVAPVAEAEAEAVAAASAVQLVVYKSERIMRVVSGDEVLREYRIALGRNPVGRKERAGDCKTPEGSYFIDRHNRASRFHKSLHISYPNSRDLAASRKRGHSPGGDVMIHGLPDGFDELADVQYRLNWTKGCIAVNNTEMDEIFELVPDGTPIIIKAHL